MYSAEKKTFPGLLTLLAVIVCGVVFGSSQVFAQVGKASPSTTAENLVKIIKLEKSLASKGDAINIYVLNDSELTTALQAKVGSKVGKSTVGTVSGGSSLPSGGTDILYIGNPDAYLMDAAALQSVKEFTRTNGVLSVTHEAMLIFKGLSLFVGVEGSTPKFMINLRASKEEGAEWQPAAVKIAETI